MTKAYWVGIVDVKNQEEYKKYADIAGPALIKAGAKILSRGGRIKNLEGKKINRAVIIEFPSMDKAEKFYDSEEYKKGSLDIRENSSPKTLSILFWSEQEKRIKKDKKYLVFNE